MATLTIFGIPVLIIIGVLCAAFFRMKNYRSNKPTRIWRIVDFTFTFIFSVAAGLALYPALSEFFSIAENLQILVAMMGTVLTEAGVTTLVNFGRSKNFKEAIWAFLQILFKK